ncbi:hypothetical protein [Candidatus Magnetominusculus xianensis]|uniref:hypothetical protein n=1 Tax=Candidatus Magnetominusculus xianensis TaxID=1748249 RepID=UPI000A10CBB6|nr:hypothetical protein [Candidatus Magnetominusculus xianensis]MBF0403313.1 hypothetical protein [Nitrospirota bacterium]
MFPYCIVYHILKGQKQDTSYILFTFEKDQRFEPLFDVINGIFDEVHDPDMPFNPASNFPNDFF